MEKITINAEFLFELKSKQDWINKVPGIIPTKTRYSDELIWVDKNGNVLQIGADFSAAETSESYPVRVYKTQTTAEALEMVGGLIDAQLDTTKIKKRT
jgi:hypothetical protein